MFKKIAIGVVALGVLAGVAFGGKLIPYSKAAFNKFQDAANNSVPVSLQLDAVREQLKAIGPEIKSMVHEVAKEKVKINQLVADLEQHEKMLETSYGEMMTLREHLNSGDEFYVAVNNKKFNKSRVEEDLRHRFGIYKTAQATQSKKKEIIRIREESLTNAVAELEQAKVQQRELEVQIENLAARNRMNEVVEASNELDINSSQLAKAREMLSELDVKISAEEEFLNIMPKYRGQIPVSPESLLPATNILEEMNQYFENNDSDASDNSVEVFQDDV